MVSMVMWSGGLAVTIGLGHHRTLVVSTVTRSSSGEVRIRVPLFFRSLF